MNEFFWQARPWQAFKNFAIIFSFVINLVFLVVLLLALPLIIPGINSIARPLVGGLNQSFVQMGEASIVRTIEVDDELPVRFTLPLQEETNVVLVEPVPMTVPATFTLPGGGGSINGVVSLELPAGTALPVALDMQVPVSETIPVRLDVGVDIPLQETDLGTPFNTLQGLFAPLDRFLGGLPQDNQDLFQRLERRADEKATGAATDLLSR